MQNQEIHQNNFLNQSLTEDCFTLPKPHLPNTDKILFINATIIDPATTYQKLGNLLVIGNLIADFGSDQSLNPRNFSDSTIIDCQGMILAPGLIDMQVHFRDPGQTNKEDLNSGSKSAVAGGITSVVCQPNTSPVIDSAFIVEYLKMKGQEEAYCNIFAYASITKSMKGEELTDMITLKKAGAVGFTDDGLPVMNANVMRRAFEYSKDLDMVIAQHAEDLNLSNKGCINEGKTSLELGVRGIPNISESVIVKRDLEILNAVGGKYHLLHVSTIEALEAIKIAKDKGLKATVEVCPHHFLLNDTAVLKSGTNAKMNPPLRSEQDRLAMIEGLKSGVIDAISTDHAPHHLAVKNLPLQEAAFGIVGVETMLPLSLKLYHEQQISLIDLLAKLTINPAKILGIDRGRIKKNAIADLVLIDINRKWKIDTNKFHSKSKNSPFNDFEVCGKAIITVVAGKIVYRSR